VKPYLLPELLLPVDTASVERSFSTMNRILNSERCRLFPGHKLTCQLMQLAVEGPRVPDVRDAEEGEFAHFSEFLDKAYRLWQPSHVEDCSETV